MTHVAPGAISATRSHLYRLLTDVDLFSQQVLRRPLRPYQLPPARAIAHSALYGDGLSFAVMMSRQAGKNETAAQLEAFLLNAWRRRGGTLVKCAPTFRPQALNSMLRLRTVFAASQIRPPRQEQAYMLCMGHARAAFFSAGENTNVVGATADILLECDEAQDVSADKWNKDFRPMGASTNVTSVLWGTAWTSQTLLAKTIHRLRWEEQKDGRRRVFLADANQVAECLPNYGRYVDSEVARLGAHHPLIRSQYFLEEIDDQAAYLPATTRALMHGSHPRHDRPAEGRAYAFLIDVAGPGEANPHELLADKTRQDATALTIVEIAPDRAGLSMPRFLVANRVLWRGQPAHVQQGALATMVEIWRPQRVVVDATGLGAPLASWLQFTYPGITEPFVFTSASKSELGWSYLGICNSGRFLDHADDGSPEQAQFWKEVAAAQYEVLDGPGQRMRWGVVNALIHDDLLISAALCAVLETPAPAGEGTIIAAPDPLADTRR